MSPVDARYFIRQAPHMTPGTLAQAAYQAAISPDVTTEQRRELARLAALAYAASTR
jgi:hypothetical protein